MKIWAVVAEIFHISNVCGGTGGWLQRTCGRWLQRTCGNYLVNNATSWAILQDKTCQTFIWAEIPRWAECCNMCILSGLQFENIRFYSKVSTLRSLSITLPRFLTVLKLVRAFSRFSSIVIFVTNGKICYKQWKNQECFSPPLRSSSSSL